KKEEMRASMLESVMDRTARDRLGRIELVNPKQAREVGDMVLRMAQAGRIRSRVTDEQLAGMLKELKELKAKEDVKIVFNRKGFDESDDEDNFEHLLYYCGAKDRPTVRAALQQELVQQLDILQLQLASCYSAHECAKAYPEIGPLLTTLSRSRAVAGSSEVSRALISAAMEYSKAASTGAYANQRAQTWFSHLARSLLCAAHGGSRRTYELPRCVLAAETTANQRFVLQQLAALLSTAAASWDLARRERVWSQAFGACCGADRAGLLEYLLPALDDCGWALLERHELLAEHSVLVLARLPPDDALELWRRLNVVRAQLSGSAALDAAGRAGIRRLVGAVLGSPEAAGQMLDDVARLALATRDPRVVDMWRRICAEEMRHSQ
ncbi:hypothetical protein IWW55_005981, partial [Coemansia sp. RSA 2706]